MKKLVYALAIVAAGGLLAGMLLNRSKTNKRLSKISDEGYETAHDILYPQNDWRNRQLRYGPVLPE